MGQNGNGNGRGGRNGKQLGGNGRLGQYQVVPKAQRAPGAPEPPKYPKKGWDFPRRNVEVMPREVLYDPTRVLGSYVYSKMKSTGETIVIQPRIESTALIQKQEIDDCPYPSQLPYIKEQIHLKPSRDAEILNVKGKIDVPANSTAKVLEFSTFNNLRTFLKWMHYEVFDALDPVQLTFQWIKDGVPLKVFACDPNVMESGGGYMPVVQSVVAANTNCFPCLPEFQNALWEITDQHKIELFATDESGFDRKVEACAWGWIESVTVWDEKVKR